MRIDGLHPNADGNLAGERYLDIGTFPKHIHIKPTELVACLEHTKRDPYCARCYLNWSGVDTETAKGFEAPEVQELNSSAIQPTEVVDIMTKLEERIDNAGILRPLVDFFMEAKQELNTLIAERERKVAVSALRKLSDDLAYCECDEGHWHVDGAIDRVIAQYERGEANE